MTPGYLKYAESLAIDLESAGQPVSAAVVRNLLAERAVLLAACKLAEDAMSRATWDLRGRNCRDMNDSIKAVKAAIAESDAPKEVTTQTATSGKR